MRLPLTLQEATFQLGGDNDTTGSSWVYNYTLCGPEWGGVTWFSDFSSGVNLYSEPLHLHREEGFLS